MAEPAIAPVPTTGFRAFHLGERFVLRRVAERLPREPDAHDHTRLAVQWDDGYVFVYAFGTVCFYNLGRDTQAAALKLLGHQFEAALEREWDTYAIEVDPDQPMQVGFKRVRLPNTRFMSLDLVALILAESVTLDVFEEKIDSVLERSLDTSRQLAETGRFDHSSGSVGRFLGVCMTVKQEIINNLYLVDKPEALWEDEAAEKLYHALFQMFEIRERYNSIELKARTLQDNMSMIASLTSNRRMERLEVAIVVLILIEVGLFVYDLFFH